MVLRIGLHIVHLVQSWSNMSESGCLTGQEPVENRIPDTPMDNLQEPQLTPDAPENDSDDDPDAVKLRDADPKRRRKPRSRPAKETNDPKKVSPSKANDWGDTTLPELLGRSTSSPAVSGMGDFIVPDLESSLSQTTDLMSTTFVDLSPTASPPLSRTPSPSDSPLRSRLKENVISGKRRLSARLFPTRRSRSSMPISRSVEYEVPFGKSTRSASLPPEEEGDTMLRQRKLVIKEIISTEKQYVEDLTLMINYFLEPLRWDNAVPRDALQCIFGNIEVIYRINKDLLADFLQRQEETPGGDILVGDIFMKLSNYFRLYTMYCIEQQNATTTHKKLLAENQAYAEHHRIQKLNPHCRQLDLLALIIKPMQRICKYPLLLRELLKNTEPDHEDYEAISTALDKVSGVVRYINERKRLGESQQKIVDIQHSVEGCPSLLAPSRKFIREGQLAQVKVGKKPSSRQIFLFNDALLVSKAKRQADAHGDSLFCAFYDLHQARIVDHADTADFSNAFELHHKDQGTSMMFCTSGLEEKRAWLKEIKAIIKEFQHQDYNANKETLIREAEQREKRRKEWQSLDRLSVDPTSSDNQDVWVMGMILWQMQTGQPLFPNLTMEQAAVAFMQRKFPPELTDSIPSELREILEDCWLENVAARPTFAMLYDRILAMERHSGSLS